MISYTLTSGFLSAIFFSFAALGLPLYSDQEDLETALKASYYNFRDAVIAKDHAKMKASTAASTYMILKNQGIAYKMEFPQAFFDGMPGKLYAQLDIKRFKVLKAIEKNNTGVLIVLALKNDRFDPYEMGRDHQSTLLTMSFIQEEGDWKFDAVSMIAIDDVEESKLLKGDLSKLDDSKFRPSGIVPSIPNEESAPDYDYDAILNVVFGSDVQVTLNGKTFGRANGSRATRTGVRKGENTVSIICNPSSGLKVTIYAQPARNSDPIKVFEHDEEKPVAEIKKTFVVNLD